MSAAEEFRNRGRELMANRTAVEHVPAAQVRVVNERRDPTGATLPVTTRYSRPGAPMISEWNAEQAYRLAYFSNVIVYRCMQILADTVAGCPFRAGDAPPIEPGAPTKHNVNARLAQLLGPPPGGPIPNKLTARRLWAWTVVQRKLTGRHGWEIEADPSTKEIVALWPLVSSEINPIPTVGGAEWFSAFEYGQDPKSKKPKTLKPNQILYGWNPSATDFRQPESCLQAARLDVSIAVMLARYNLAFLKNDARPAAVVVTEAFESDEAFYAFKAQWGGQYGGPDNAGKVAFVETSDDPDSSTPPLKPSEAIGFATLGLSQRDAMFMEQEKASLERVAMACGVPWSRLSATDRCVDDETEALTQRGWVSGADMTTEDTILSMDVPTGRLTWSPVREIYRAHYSGPMYRLKHKHADFLVTPGHNWATTDGRLVHVEDLTRSTTIRAMGEPEDSNDDEVYSSAFVELVGWAVTEGCYDSLSYVRLCQNEGPNADRIRAVLNVTGAQWSEGRQKDRPLMRFYLRGEIARAVTAVSPGKIMTPEFLVALTAKQRELLLQTMIDADGARQSSTASWIFTQRDKRAAEAFSMLAALAGYTTSMRHEVSTPGFMRWRVIVRQRKVMTVRRNTRTVEHYDGTVWCPRTDFGTFVARRHGRVIVTGNTYDNAGQEDSNFWMDTMLPLLSDLADEVNMQLAPRLGREVGWFDLSHVKVFKATRTTLAIDPVNLYKSAVALKNEARDMVGLPPLDGGDVFITPEEAALMAGPAPVPIARESFAELQQAVALPTAAEIATLVAAQMRVVPDVEHRDAPLPLPPVEQRVVDPDEVEQRRAVIWKATNATVRTFEKQWATAMQRLFTRQRKQVLSRLEGRTGRGNIGQRVAEGRASTDDVFDPDYWVGETTDAVEPLYSNVTAAALGKMADVFGVAFDLEAAFVTDFIQARANKLAGQVTDTTYTAIRDAMSEGTQAGETITEIADRVRAVFDLADAVRAETIARTEVNSAYGGSTRLASEALPADVLGGFQWIATRDGRTRDDHADADGQTVGPDGTFDVGGEQLEYPGDPAGDPANTVNCRCAMVALTPDDMDGRARVSIEHAAAVLGGLRGPVDELALRRVLRGQRALPAPVEPSVDQQTAPMPPIHLTINMPDQPPVNVQVDPAQVNVTVEPPPPAEVNVQVDAPEVNVTMPPERAKVAVRDPETGAVLRWEPEAS